MQGLAGIAVHDGMCSLSAACFLASWRRCLRRGVYAALSAAERTSLTVSSARLCSCASCVRPSCPRRSSAWRRSIPPSAPLEPSRSSPRWCRAWPAFPSQSLESTAHPHASHDPHWHAHLISLPHSGGHTSVIIASLIHSYSLNITALLSVCDPGAQTSHTGQFCEIEIYASSESC